MSRKFFFAFIMFAAMVTKGWASSLIDYTVSVKVPNLAWQVKVVKMVEVDQHLHIVAELSQFAQDNMPMVGAMVVMPVKDKVYAEYYDASPTVYVIGKTWRWENTEDYQFISSMDEIKDKLSGGSDVKFERK